MQFYLFYYCILLTADPLDSPLSSAKDYTSPLPKDSPTVRRLFRPDEANSKDLSKDVLEPAAKRSKPNQDKMSLTPATQSSLSSPLPSSSLPSGSVLLSPGKPTGSTSPKRTTSLGLFYRKVYVLAYLRLKDLCERLNIASDVMQK